MSWSFPSPVQAWPVRAMTELTLESLRPVAEAPDPVDVLLLGRGPSMAPVPPACSSSTDGKTGK